MLLSVIFGFTVLLLLTTTLYQITCVFLLIRHLARKRALAVAPVRPASLPGISVLIPVKGVYPTFGGNLRSILEQSYPGPFEVILGVKDETDPVLDFARGVAQAAGSKVAIKFAVGGKDAGLNPKNSNLCRAFPLAQHEWIYCSDADVALEPNFFTNALPMMDPNKYGSTFNIFRGAPNLGAMLEAVGTNIEATGFFLFSSLFPAKGPMNGACMFFHRSLIERVGGVGVAVNQITDDLFLANRFAAQGAQFQLLPNNPVENIPGQSFSVYWNRVLRWLLITRCNRPDLFYAAPTSWTWQWSLVAALVSGEARFAGLFFLAALGRLLFALVFHCALAGWREWWKVGVVVVYDACGPVVWFLSLFQKKIVWAGNKMIVGSGGTLEPV